MVFPSRTEPLDGSAWTPAAGFGHPSSYLVKKHVSTSSIRNLQEYTSEHLVLPSFNHHLIIIQSSFISSHLHLKICCWIMYTLYTSFFLCWRLQQIPTSWALGTAEVLSIPNPPELAGDRPSGRHCLGDMDRPSVGPPINYRNYIPHKSHKPLVKPLVNQWLTIG